MAFLFLTSLLLNGYLLTHFLLKKPSHILTVSSMWIFGMLATLTPIFLLANVFHTLLTALWIYTTSELGIFVWIIARGRRHIFSAISFKSIDIVFVLLVVVFFLFFQRTFTYDTTHGNLLIASNLYVDFGAHIPFIRSFSFGNNYPSEVPFFAGSGLQYHFLFDFAAGVLESLGMRIDIALNLLSALSLTTVFLLVYMWGKKIGKSKSVGILSCVFFFLPSTLAFWEFFKLHGVSLSAIYHNSFYAGNFPFEKGLVAGFWNMNTYLNQRQLIFGLACVLLISYIVFYRIEIAGYRWMKTVFLGGLIGFLSLWHMTAFLSLVLVIGSLWIINKEKETFRIVLIALVIAAPLVGMIVSRSHNNIVIQPGFLINAMKDPLSWLQFWVMNLGFSLLTMALGFFLAGSEKKNIAFMVLPLFILPNIVHISSRFPFDDHKFFNIWIVYMNIYSAVCIIWLFRKSIFWKFVGFFAVSLLTFSGVINIFVMKNDVYAQVADYPQNAFLQWSRNHILNNTTILTNGEIYDPLSLVGKKIYLGRARYIYVYGDDVDERIQIREAIFTSHDPKRTVALLKRNMIHYLVIYNDSFAKNTLSVDREYFKTFMKKQYEDKDAVVFSLY